MARNLLIYLDKNALHAFAPGMTSPLKMSFASAEVADLEVVNSTLLEKNVAEFRQKLKAVPNEAVLVLATNVTFDRNFPPDEPDLPQLKQNFLDSAPFDETAAKEVTTVKGTVLVLANRNFYNAVKTAWELTGTKVKMVIPEVLLPKEPEKFDIKKTASLKSFLENLPHYHNFSLTTVVESAPEQIRHQASRQFEINRNLKLLIPLLFASFLVLLAAYIWTLR